MPALKVSEIAALCGGVVSGDGERVIAGASTLEEAGASDVSFVAQANFESAAGRSDAGCLVCDSQFALTGPWSLVRVRAPREAFAMVLRQLYPTPPPIAFRHPTAEVDESVQIGKNVSIGAFTIVGANSVIGDGCTIEAWCAIGAEVNIGPGSRLKAHVTIYDRVTVGARALLHAGCVLGADGFGFAFDEAAGRFEKFPQVGTVILGDDVEIGANSCVDRAALGATRIGDGCKLDNLVHVGHNCQVGKHVVMAAQCGLSGGVEVGDYAVLGGQVGIADKARIASRAVLGAQCGVLPSKRVPAGEPQWGTPARPLRQHLKSLASLAKMPHFEERLKRLENRGQDALTQRVPESD